MNLIKDQSSEGVIDLQLQDFMERESRKQQFQGLVHSLTDICWETCIDKPTVRLETKIEKCLINCVERFIDTTNFITNRLKQSVITDNSDLDLE